MKAIFSTLVALAGSVTLLQAEMVNGIMAVVDAAVISAYQVREATAPAAEELARQYRNDRSPRFIRPLPDDDPIANRRQIATARGAV